MNKTFKVNYLSRDFSTIKQDLISYAKRYYPNNFSDLTDSSINTFLIESVAYVGDILSFYTDFQANESFLSTAVQSKNVENLAKSLGYRVRDTSTSSGYVTIYMLIPSNNNNAPDYTKAPTIKKGSTISSGDGAKKFIINEDILIDENLIGTEYVVARTNNLGNPTYFAIKFKAPVVSGEIITKVYSIGEYQKFLKLFLGDTSIAEIISIFDREGNEYYEVSNMSQNVVYRSFLDASLNDSSVKYMLKPITAQRRFVFDYENGQPYLLFGAKQYKPDEDLSVNPIVEPTKFILEKYNNDYLKESYFDPNKLLNGDNFGIAPENTNLIVTYRKNSFFNNNAGITEINNVQNLLISFDKTRDITSTLETTIRESIQVLNEEEIIGDTVSPTLEELRDLGGMIYQAQNRAVTAKDYETLSYMMPAKYGSIKRVRAERDSSSSKNNINLYVICSDRANSLIAPTTAVKQNLKTWLSEYKMVTDTVDILPAKIINLQIKFTVLADTLVNKLALRDEILNSLLTYFSQKPQIGEAFSKLDVLKQIRKFNSVLDVVGDIEVTNVTSTNYSSLQFNVEENTTSDGRFIKIPKNAIYEIKFSNDIIGNVI
jgi:hypothetical protein